jgi:hypothetical protein
MMSDSKIPTTAISAQENEDIDQLRQLSLEDRGKLIGIACRAAAKIEASRARMGLPPTEPAPWPDSTWNYLSEWARRGRRK